MMYDRKGSCPGFVTSLTLSFPTCDRWKIGGDCSQDDIVDAELELKSKLGGSCDFIHWVNPPHLKSLPEIDHIHILVRRTEQAIDT